MEHHGATSWLLSLPLLPHNPEFLHVNGAVVVFLLITLVSVLAHLAIRKDLEAYIVPSPRFTLPTIVDFGIEGLRNMVTGTLGEEGIKYFPFIASLFIFIFFGNVLGLFPLGVAPTSNPNTTFGLGIAAFVYYNIMGVREHGVVGYMKHFLMGLGPLGVLVAVLEIASQMVRPISLGVRLYVNMHVDHTMLLSFQNLFAWLLPVPLLLFGIIVATIQAFVFAILTAVYVQMATEHEAAQAGHGH